jgi:aryl-alcohol dehydrogenase
MAAQPITVAAIRGAGEPFTIEQATMEQPGRGEVLVRIAGVGLCHTDLVVRDQQAPFPLPAVLGHEGSGVIEAVGEDVVDLAVGMPVVLTFDSCGICRNCLRNRPAYCVEFYARNFSGHGPDGCGRIQDSAGSDLHRHFFGQSSFASHALVAQRSAVPIADDVPLEIMGPLGCGIQTGAGAVLEALRVEAGSTIAIFGAGSVGLSALLAAKVAECTTIILIDRSTERLDLAKELGATHVIDANTDDAVERVQAITGGGADYSLECTGVPAVLRQAVDVLAVPGVCGVVGVAPYGSEVALDITGLVAGRTVRGIIEGDSDPRRFIPRLIELWRAGRFPFDRLISSYPLAAINEAVEAVHQGGVIKAVLYPAR